ncbi:hypothetical protein ABK040_008911 [Willaertia magna]
MSVSSLQHSLVQTLRSRHSSEDFCSIGYNTEQLFSHLKPTKKTKNYKSLLDNILYDKDLFVIICSFLTFDELIQLTHTSKRFFKLGETQTYIWKERCIAFEELHLKQKSLENELLKLAEETSIVCHFDTFRVVYEPLLVPFEHKVAKTFRWIYDVVMDEKIEDSQLEWKTLVQSFFHPKMLVYVSRIEFSTIKFIYEHFLNNYRSQIILLQPFCLNYLPGIESERYETVVRALVGWSFFYGRFYETNMNEILGLQSVIEKQDGMAKRILPFVQRKLSNCYHNVNNNVNILP